MLSQEQIEIVVSEANKQINIPVVGEKFEKKIITKALYKIDAILDEEMPEEFAQLLGDASEGIEPADLTDVTKMKEKLVNFLNKKIELPIFSEEGEKELFVIVTDIIVNALQKGKKIEAV